MAPRQNRPGGSDALRLKIAASDSDPEDLERLTLQLRQHLVTLDLDSIEFARSEPPAGAKAAIPVTAGELIIALAASGGVITSLIAAIQSWLTRQERCTVTLEIGGDKLHITGASQQDRGQLIESWVKRRGRNARRQE